MAAAESDGAFVDLVTSETDSCINGFVDNLAFDNYRDGTGQRGVRSSAATNVITLTVPDDARNFFVGMTVAAGTSTTSLRTGTTTVAGVDLDAGTVTLTLASSISNFQDGDLLFRSKETGNILLEGLAALLPLTAPSPSENFRGIDRSVHASLLAGSRQNSSGANTVEEDALLTAKIVYDGGGNKATYGFEGFDIATAAGTLRAISDPDCPTNRGYVLKLATVYLKTLKNYPHVITDDTLKGARVYNEDTYEIRMRAMGNMIITEPGANGVFAI